MPETIEAQSQSEKSPIDTEANVIAEGKVADDKLEAGLSEPDTSSVPRIEVHSPMNGSNRDSREELDDLVEASTEKKLPEPPTEPEADVTKGTNAARTPSESEQGEEETVTSKDNNNNNLSETTASMKLPTEPTTRKSISGGVSQFFVSSLTGILDSKEAKKNLQLKEITQKALDTLRSETPNNQIVFDALKAACETNSNSLKVKAIDIFAKSFDYGLLEGDPSIVSYTDHAVDVISGCFEGEGTDPHVETQVLRALTNSILIMPCHGASLLKAVRQIYNIFIFSLSSDNQLIAQGTLNQVISAVFSRINEKDRSNNTVTATTQTTTTTSDGTPSSEVPLTLQTLEQDALDDDKAIETTEGLDTEENIFVKDAFLIFRAMCKLSVKSLESEVLDMRSHSVRSKLLSLHIIHTILKDHIEIFLSHDISISTSNETTRLINAVRQYLSLSLSRNAASPLAPVFELSLEIFWLIISNLRSDFKREIPVFFDEIYLPVAEMKTSTSHQKRYLLSTIGKLCNDSRCIIEFYLNYDCDPQMPNICEKIIDYLTKMSLVRVEVTPQQKLAYKENKKHGISVYDISKTANLASGKMTSKPPEPDVYNHFPLEYALQMESIDCSVAFLKSLYSWAQKVNPTFIGSGNPSGNPTANGSNSSLRRIRSNTTESNNSPTNTSSFFGEDVDSPEQFESQKQRKKAFLEGVKQFNIKPKKGVQYFLDNGFISEKDPKVIAKFLLNSDALDKAQLGEFLGEGDEWNLSIMHAFVDEMDFEGLKFVESLRRFLQSFRLPGEAQKIDRFMLKFAERYLKGNPSVFSHADAAYILAYSVIMLNTDQHSPQVKVRMTFDQFVMNNAGIDDGKDLPREFLKEIYDEIVNNEIKLQSEQHAALISGNIDISASGSGFFGGRGARAEAYTLASREMSTKTEKLVRSLGKKVKSDSGVFYVASHMHHVKSIFDTLWMSILAGLTPPFKEYEEKETTDLCLEGIKLSIKIACMFEIDFARTSFIRALVQFSNLNSYEEMKSKSVDAVYVLLDIAISEGDHLGASWNDILTCISQLERLQLIAQGVDQTSIPDVVSAKLNKPSIESSRTSASTGFFGFSSAPTAAQTASQKFHNQHLTVEVAKLLTQTDLEVAMDRVFSNSANLSRESIVIFVKALSQVSNEEIESSAQSESPRMFSLQKVVDVCYYNMSRIRLEWSQLWAIMGETFNEVGCHPNSIIAFFALDSLRQLSMRFFEIEELAHFKFQKEFLRPFQHIITHNESLEVKDMVLECINNMVLAKADQIKSGWKTIFGVLIAAAKENKESLVQKTYKMANAINKEYSEEVQAQESFSELVICFTELAKNERFQRISLLSLDVLSKLIRQVAGISFKNKQTTDLHELEKLWFPVLFAFYDIIMTGEELEVRSRALNALFAILMEYGKYFQNEFWDMISEKLLFPIFRILSNYWELSNINDSDKLSVWLSTTLIQALRNMITLFTHFYESLGRMLDKYLELLISCICQENDTIARIGRSCLHNILIDNAAKFEVEEWVKITKAFDILFELTTAKELFVHDPLRAEASEDGEDSDISESQILQETEARLRKSKEKSTIVVKCVLQLLMIETLSEIFENETFYENIPYEYLVKLAKLLEDSHTFAKKFNDDYDLRVRLYNAGVIERLPNLLKQESSSSAVFINIMFRMYCDDDKTNDDHKQQILSSLIPLSESIISRYGQFDESSQSRNITTWRPVVVEILQGYVELDEEDFNKYSVKMYGLCLKLLAKQSPQDLRIAMKVFFSRVGDIFVKTDK